MTTFTMADLVQAEQTLLGKMQENSRLRDEFVSNPREVILRELNIQVPQGLEVMPIEAQDDTLLVPIQAAGGIPARLPSLESPELDAARNQLIERLATDGEFKRAFQTDAKGVIAREFGVSMPKSLKVETVEVPANALMVVIPALASEDDELSETELESYAGGKKKKKIKSPIKINVGKGGVSVGVNIPGTDIGGSASVGVGSNGVSVGAEGHGFGSEVSTGTTINGDDFKGSVSVGPDGVSVSGGVLGVGGSASVGVGNNGVSVGAEAHAGGIGAGAHVGVGAGGVDVGAEGEAFGVDKGIEAHVGPDGASVGADDFVGGHWNASIDGQGVHGEGYSSGISVGGSITGDGIEGSGGLDHVGVGVEGSITGGGVDGSVDDKPNLPNVPTTPDANFAGNK